VVDWGREGYVAKVSWALQRVVATGDAPESPVQGAHEQREDAGFTGNSLLGLVECGAGDFHNTLLQNVFRSCYRKMNTPRIQRHCRLDYKKKCLFYFYLAILNLFFFTLPHLLLLFDIRFINLDK
jgi:hypothetical protein